MQIEVLIQSLEGVRPCSGGYVCRCPAHDDRHASLSLTVKDGKILAHCHAGCEFDDIVAAMGLKPSDFMPEQDEKPSIVASYEYTDESEAPLFRVLRYRPKDFRQQRWDGKGWAWGLNGTRRVPFRLPELLEAIDRGATVYVVEGEKDVLSLARLGLTATCNAGGADEGKGSKWRPEFADYLKGADVVILPDNDEPGRRHAAHVKATLEGKARAARIVTLPGLPEHGDVSDWIERGGTADALAALATSSDRVPAPQQPSAPRELARVGLSVPAVLARLRGEGQRFPTGFPTVDAKTNGGVPRGKMVTLVGKPGAGKTSIATQMALSQARSAPGKIAILAIYQDGGLDDACLTIAQQCGSSRERAQLGEVADEVAAALDGIWIDLVDINERYSLEEVADRFCAGLPDGMIPLFIFDSAQVLRSKEADAQRSQFDKVRVVSDLVRSATNRHRAITYLVSQANRGAYKNKVESEANDPLASGSGSSNLEYMPDLHLYVGTKDGRILMRCQKNRLGEDQEWQLVLGNDKPRHRHLEIDSTALAEEFDDKHETLMRHVETLVLAELRREPRQSTRSLFAVIKAKDAHVREAIKRLYAAKRVARENGPRGAILWFPLV